MIIVINYYQNIIERIIIFTAKNVLQFWNNKMGKKQYVEFKSIPEYYKKEEFGLKCNTVRKLPLGDVRENKLRVWATLQSYGNIIITNTKTRSSFIREVTDISIWEGVIIISWKHPSQLE